MPEKAKSPEYLDPIAETFGFPLEDISPEAQRHRTQHLCPYNNGSEKCTKDKAEDPLGVCSIRVPGERLPTITCPTRFRENWQFAKDAAAFFFPAGARWTTISEVRLRDDEGKIVGNIDHVLVHYDEADQIVDFGTVEVQAVYVSGNIRDPFRVATTKTLPEYQKAVANGEFYVRADNLSSRKRLVPQLASKGAILKEWGKKQAIVVDEPFFSAFPEVAPTNNPDPDLLWLIYGLEQPDPQTPYRLTLRQKIETDFTDTLDALNRTDFRPEPMKQFMGTLQEQLDRRIQSKNAGTAK